VIYRGLESPGNPGVNKGGPVTFDTAAAFKVYGKTVEWQTHEIQVVGQFATVLVNDRLVAQGYLGKQEIGFIGLQAESGAAEFRSIQILEESRPIPPRNSDGFVSIVDGKTFNGWKLANPASTPLLDQGGRRHERHWPKIGRPARHAAAADPRSYAHR
jgi:Domain of Unknown Function (DUF1080)